MLTPKTLEDYRKSIVGAIEATKLTFAGGYPLVIEYDNRILVDTQKQTDPYLQVEIVYLGAEQADLSENPIHRLTGMIILTAKVKEGGGTAELNKLMEAFYPALQRKNFGDVRTFMSDIVTAKAQTKDGWVGLPVTIPFLIHKVYA